MLDGAPIEYEYQKVELDKTCCDLNGRYCITVILRPDGREHRLSCIIKDYQPSTDDEVESGERLELKSFYCNGTKLSIGMEGNSGYVDGERISEYDYNNEYLEDGVEYELLRFTCTARYVFGIAWIENYSAKNGIQTWFGADPTMENYMI